MQATNGSASSFRSRGRLIGCCMALALALSALVLAPVASAKTKPPVTTYLATGDSIAFGYSQEKFEANFPNEAPSYFEVNYPNDLAATLRKEKTSITGSKGLTVVNNACPGETSDSLFGTGPLKAADPTATPACRYHFENGLPLHNDLGTLSQAEDSLLVLNPAFGKGVAPPNHEIKLVTFGIGGNDELASIAKCKAEVKEEFETKGTSQYEQAGDKEKPAEVKIADSVKACIVEHTPAVAEHIAGNLKTFLGLMRTSGAGGGNYTGPIEVLGNYNPDSFILPGSDSLQHVVNNFLKKATEEVGGIFVDPTPKTNPPPEGGPKEKKALEKYTEMFNAKDIAANKAKCEANATKEKEEGKLVVYPCTEEGDIHPTEAGHKLFAKLLAEAL